MVTVSLKDSMGSGPIVSINVLVTVDTILNFFRHGASGFISHRAYKLTNAHKND